MGLISKSLLTGKNYHTTTGVLESGTLRILANVIIEGSLTIDGNNNSGNLEISVDNSGMSIKNTAVDDEENDKIIKRQSSDAKPFLHLENNDNEDGRKFALVKN